MSEQVSKKRKQSVKALPLSFDEIRSIIQIGDSTKLKELIKDGRIDDINKISYNTSPYQTLLSIACRSGSIDCAEILLNNGANVNFVDSQNCNPVLKSMLASGNVDLIRFIIARGLTLDDKTLLNSLCDREVAANTVITEILIGLIKDVNYSFGDIYNRGRSSFLYNVSIAGNVSATRNLLARGATQLSSALSGACTFGRVEVVKLLLDKVKGKVDRTVINEELNDALFEASRHGQLAVVQLVFEYNSDSEGSKALGHCEAKTKPDWVTRQAMKNALEAASYPGDHIAVIKFLNEHGADVGALNAAFCRAASGSSVEVVELLIDSGADVNVIQPREYHNEDQNPLIVACRNDRTSTVRLLLARGADPNDRRVRSPLVAAIKRRYGPLEVIQLLLQHGADPNYRRDTTPPLKAALQRPDVLRALLEHGANANLPFADGKTALLEVLEHAHTTSLDAFTFLLQNDADPNLAKARTGQTPLMVAATACRVEYVKLLLEYGADVTQVNTAGQTVLDLLGRTRKYSEVVALCTSYVESNRPGEKHVLK